MTLLFIRHSEDDFDYPKFSHDLPITKGGIRLTKKLTKKLIRKHGVPDVIYLSPFKRCRSTVEIMVKTILKEQNAYETLTAKDQSRSGNSLNFKSPKITIDNRLTKYYTISQQSHPNARPETLKHNPPTSETKEDVFKRSKSILNELRISIKPNEVVWCVTHAIVVSKVCKMIGNPYRTIDFLQVIKV